MNDLNRNKSREIKSLIEELKFERSNQDILVRRKGQLTDVSLINHFAKHDFIPNKWFDWENKINARIIIIGQDWGPYKALIPYIERYEVERARKNFDYDKFLFETFSSRTEKFIIKAVEQTYKEKFSKEFPDNLWGKFFFTMAVLFTRQGVHFRGNDNFDSKRSSEICFQYVSKQLEIVQPKVIVTLGELAFSVVNKHYKLGFKEKSITKIIESLNNEGVIKISKTYIIPNFHPAAHVNPKIQLSIWSKLWDLV